MIIYLAGPYGNRAEGKKRANLVRAWRVAKILWGKGYVVISPHLNSAYMDEDIPEVRFSAGYLQVLSFCDALFRLPGKSPGTEAEVAAARRWCIPVYTSIARLERRECDSGRG